MANREHLKTLKQGVERWNERRKENHDVALGASPEGGTMIAQHGAEGEVLGAPVIRNPSPVGAARLCVAG